MPTYVILLRGVNVGKAKRVPMAEFKQLLIELGCTQATTLLNSGNAVVRHTRVASSSLAQQVARAMALRFGFEVPVVVHSATEFQAVVDGNILSFTEEEHARLMVVFSQDLDTIASLEALRSLLSPGEQLALGSQAAYLHCAGGILESTAGAALLGKLGRAVTTRNWSTVLKLMALVGSSRA